MIFFEKKRRKNLQVKKKSLHLHPLNGNTAIEIEGNPLRNLF